ncbi:MAG: hypothetical protein R3B59_11025 [Dehalococcoidia bacterium]
MPDNYEFSAQQDTVFQGLHRSLNLFALANIALGIATLVIAYILAVEEDEVFAGGVVLVLGILYCALGVVWRRPLDNLRRIVRTRGEDINELMVVTDDLKWAFMVSAGIFAAFLVLRLILSFGYLFDTDLGQ